MSRTDDVISARAAADEWATARGLPASGGYSGDWYVNGYLGGWWPENWLYWLADYSIAPELLPMRPAHQFSSTPIDQDVMLDSEIINPDFPQVPPETTPPDPPDPCASVTAQRDGLVTTVADIADRLGDLLLIEADRLQKPMRRWVIRDIVKQMQAERTEAAGSRQP